MNKHILHKTNPECYYCHKEVEHPITQKDRSFHYACYAEVLQNCMENGLVTKIEKDSMVRRAFLLARIYAQTI